MSPKTNKPAKVPATPVKVPMMKIQAIPPWSGSKPKPPAVPIPATAKQDITLATSPTPAPSTDLKKLNPASKPFEFKPNAKQFQPGQPAATPAPAPTSTSGAGPSSTKAPNPFFSHPPAPLAHNPKDDFCPWKNGQVPHPTTICKLKCLLLGLRADR